MCRMRKLVIAIALSASTFAFSAKSQANIFDDTWGIVTDPIKLRQSSATLADSLDRTLAQLETLEGKADVHIAERLEQIRSIIKEAMGGTEQLLDKATADMLRLEVQVNVDAIDLIYRAQCAATETINQGRQAFANVVSDLGRADPGLYILGLKIIDLRTKTVQVEYPDQAYWNMKKKLFDHLRASVKDDTDAYDIFSAYTNLGEMARLTLCSYINQPAANKIWTQEMNQMEVLAAPWTDVVLVTKK